MRWSQRRITALAPDTGRNRLPMLHKSTLAERLWSGAVADGTGCWIWQGALNTHRKRGDYGQLRRGGPGGGNRVLAHRLAYELVKGPIPASLTIDHLCRNTLCINPDHLEAVTNQENVQRGVDFRRNEKAAP